MPEITTPTLETDQTDQRREARTLYWTGWRVSSIAKHLNIKRATVESWKQRDKWGEAPVIERVETSIEARLVQLVHKDKKSGTDFKEIDLLGRQIERLARVRRYEAPGGHEGDLNPNLERRNAGPKKKPVRNEFSEEQIEQLENVFRDSLFDYQKVWFRNGHQRTRSILKSRQIGATWYFAREALLDAVKTGRNQIFLSASKAQAHVFRQYIVQFAREACDVDLTGDPIVLPNGAHLYFLGTNAKTAQGYHGNFYFDEFFWVNNFETLNKVASGMAAHQHWRRTYFSTPSSVNHQAYPFWTGERHNKGRRKEDQIHIDVSHNRLQGGFTGEDKIWRMIATLLDAEAGGCNLFDIDELRFEYTADQFENLFMCGFIDDSQSIFPLATMQRCMVDSWLEWDDVKHFADRPFGDRPVWIGYDPSNTGDSAGCAVIAPPLVPGGKFRLLEHHQWRGMDFEAQAEEIRKLTQRYNVEYIGVDSTGMGQGVYQNVKKFYPAVDEILYSVQTKSNMVIKTQHVINRGRFEFDAGALEVAQAFMAIKKILTPSGQQVTYQADRNDEISHADLAWACMHAISHEPFAVELENDPSSSFLEIYS